MSTFRTVQKAPNQRQQHLEFRSSRGAYKKQEIAPTPTERFWSVPSAHEHKTSLSLQQNKTETNLNQVRTAASTTDQAHAVPRLAVYRCYCYRLTGGSLLDDNHSLRPTIGGRGGSRVCRIFSKANKYEITKLSNEVLL